MRSGFYYFFPCCMCSGLNPTNLLSADKMDQHDDRRIRRTTSPAFISLLATLLLVGRLRVRWSCICSGWWWLGPQMVQTKRKRCNWSMMIAHCNFGSIRGLPNYTTLHRGHISQLMNQVDKPYSSLNSSVERCLVTTSKFYPFYNIQAMGLSPFLLSSKCSSTSSYSKQQLERKWPSKLQPFLGYWGNEQGSQHISAWCWQEPCGRSGPEPGCWNKPNEANESLGQLKN